MKIFHVDDYGNITTHETDELKSGRISYMIKNPIKGKNSSTRLYYDRCFGSEKEALEFFIRKEEEYIYNNKKDIEKLEFHFKRELDDLKRREEMLYLSIEITKEKILKIERMKSDDKRTTG